MNPSEWTPRLVKQCGFHTHCIRCFDQLDNFNEKCLQIFVNGFDCQRRTNSNQSCSWSPFSTWNRVNETIYRRNRTCRETFHSEKTSQDDGSWKQDSMNFRRNPSGNLPFLGGTCPENVRNPLEK
ncbi:unnamed protein product [Adineta ricciae]|uniref:Uncharacterized protein n=1 Tax=Adineta ricciae TaxID=249248 RepID=A0A816HLH5_ADIRI|nr:unnamed protein product [Adineta ricciae]